MYTKIVHPLNPYIFNDSEILILGSLPSVKSREEKFYYMHPKNRFWLLLEIIFQADFTNRDILVKKALLKKHKIALYDVIECCEIINSDDSSIRNVIPVNIKKMIQGTNVSRIFINGKKAWTLFLKYNPDLVSIATYLPSTSPANAQYNIEKLIIYWKTIN